MNRQMRSAPIYSAKVAKRSLKELLGESAASAIIYYLGEEALRDPEIFVEKLRALLGEGADIVLKYILEEVETSGLKSG